MSSACRKYEEAYSLWRFFKSDNPNWNKEGIDDTQLTEVEWEGNSPEEAEAIRGHKIQALLNMAACNIKSQNYVDALPETNEVLKLDPGNKTALYRRSRAVSLPVNASVEDLRLAIKDLQDTGSTEPRVTKEIERLEKMVAVNRKRERETYSKMFFANKSQQQGGGGESVTDYV